MRITVTGNSTSFVQLVKQKIPTPVVLEIETSLYYDKSDP